MLFRKRAARTGLEVTLEGERAVLVGEFDQNVNLPGTSVCGVRTLAEIVGLEAESGVTGYTRVIPLPISQASQNVDATFAVAHGEPPCNRKSVQERQELCVPAVRVAIFSTREAIRSV
jgi:hypothetical protein